MTQDDAFRVARIAIFIGIVLCLFLAAAAFSRDLGQWEEHTPEIRAWFSQLKQPDTMNNFGGGISCCGESDAYYADEVKYKNGKMIAVITDDRPDDKLMRMHEDIGTEYEVPTPKIVSGQGGNPTGHVIIFLGTRSWHGETATRQVLCYVMGGGV